MRRFFLYGLSMTENKKTGGIKMSKTRLLQIIDDLEELQTEGLYEFDSPEDRAITELLYILQDTVESM